MGEVVRLDNDKINIIEKVILAAPQVDLQTTHHIVDGHYYRTILVPAGVVLTGARHRHDHTNICTGDITVSTDEGMRRLTGHHVMRTKAGMKRVGFAHQNTVWITIYKTDLTDIEAIEDEMTDESERLQTRTLKLQDKEPVCHLE